jgi:putative transposase
VVVEGEDRYHYQALMDYIHLNAVRAKLIQPGKGQSVLDYAWSSLASEMNPQANQWHWLCQPI